MPYDYDTCLTFIYMYNFIEAFQTMPGCKLVIRLAYDYTAIQGYQLISSCMFLFTNTVLYELNAKS